MLFDVEQDTGQLIVGYLVPDAFSASARIRIVSGGREIAVVDANDIRTSVVSAGRHETGKCGFILNKEVVENIADIEDLELRDAQTDLVIYRRRTSSVSANFRLFRLETRYERLAALDSAIARCFQLSFPEVDRSGRETTMQCFMLKSTESVFVSARLPYKDYEYSIDAAFKKICFLQDPYWEMAESIIALAQRTDEANSLRDKFVASESQAYFADLDCSNDREVVARIREMPESVETFLSNPLARTLASRNQRDPGGATSLSASVEALSSFDIVAIRDRPETLVAPLAELLGLDQSTLPPLPELSDASRQLSEALRHSRKFDGILELDLEIYRFVSNAVAEAY